MLFLYKHLEQLVIQSAAGEIVAADELLSIYAHCRPLLRQELVVQIACGEDFTLAITKGQGGVFSWGNDDCGQLGHGRLQLDEGCLCHPKRIESTQLSRYGRVQQIACGEKHVLALTETKHVFTWGETERGQCGAW